MSRNKTDIDIDVADRDTVLACLDFAYAMKIENDRKKHNTGVYFQPIPIDPYDGGATIDYREANDLGYFKIDILNVSIYKDVKNEKHLIKLMNTEPAWDLLEHKEIVSKLFHIGNYHALVKKLKPKSIIQLAAVLALIRPSKQHLQDKGWDEIMKEVWIPPTDGSYYFKKSHSLAYANAIVVQLNLMIEQLYH